MPGRRSKFWADRYATVSSPDVLVRRNAIEKLKNAAVAVDRWRRYADSSLQQARARLMEAESKLASAGADDAARRDADDVVAALRRLVMVNDRQRDFLAEAARQLNRWVADAGAAASARDWRERLADGWVTLRDSLRAVWNFELFAVEDSAVIDGQTVATSRGVTVGKSIGAVLLFLVGYGVVARLARAFSARLVAQGHDAARVRTVRRWLLAITAAVLAVLTLNVARIPLHVFAFMGGALAIGVGFGMQTIIKNLISGMIVLAERRIQIGDIVDVDGINGTVTTVDLRSTTVRSFDGLETMVPNSTLLENKVTNWTMSDRHVRRVVRVGVAYGTRMREAADLLEACARRHGNVLTDPAPYVLFEDFGDNAQMLALHFWVELGPRVSAALVASDLRFMIEKQFAENGIVIAYPQRDVHLAHRAAAAHRSGRRKVGSAKAEASAQLPVAEDERRRRRERRHAAQDCRESPVRLPGCLPELDQPDERQHPFERAGRESQPGRRGPPTRAARRAARPAPQRGRRRSGSRRDRSGRRERGPQWRGAAGGRRSSQTPVVSGTTRIVGGSR